MAKVVQRRPDGTLLVEVAPEEVGDLNVGARVDVHRADSFAGAPWPEASVALAGEFPAITSADIAAARRNAWASSSR